MEHYLYMVQQAIGKDTDAFIYITDSVKGKLYHTAYVILGTESDACEAVDEAVYNALRNIHRLREPQYFVTWITRILINQCAKIKKRQKRELPYENIQERNSEYFDTLPIHEAVSKLPDELKIIVSLRYFSDMTVPDIADLLSIPQGTVKSRQRKALSLLRLELEDETL